jgi:hypothetical protein
MQINLQNSTSFETLNASSTVLEYHTHSLEHATHTHILFSLYLIPDSLSSYVLCCSDEVSILSDSLVSASSKVVTLHTHTHTHKEISGYVFFSLDLVSAKFLY